MKKCPRCGSEYDDTFERCPFCSFIPDAGKPESGPGPGKQVVAAFVLLIAAVVGIAAGIFVKANGGIKELWVKLFGGDLSVTETQPTPTMPVCAESDTDRAIRLTWTPVEGAERYAVYRVLSADALTEIGSTQGTSFIEGGLVTGEEYVYIVRAVGENDTVTLAESGPVIATAVGTPNVPEVSIAPQGSKTLKLSWQPCPGATQYNVYRYSSKIKNYRYIGTSKTTEYTDTDLFVGVTYYYKVLSAYKTDELRFVSELSEAVSALSQGPPERPADFRGASPEAGAILLEWAGSRGATSYRIFRLDNGNGVTCIAETAELSFRDTNLQSGSTYRYEIMAVMETDDGTYPGAYSEPISVKCG